MSDCDPESFFTHNGEANNIDVNLNNTPSTSAPFIHPLNNLNEEEFINDINNENDYNEHNSTGINNFYDPISQFIFGSNVDPNNAPTPNFTHQIDENDKLILDMSNYFSTIEISKPLKFHLLIKLKILIIKLNCKLYII